MSAAGRIYQNDNTHFSNQIVGEDQPSYTSRLMAEPTREEIAQTVAAAEARTDTKIVRLEGKMDTILATLTGKMEAISTEIAASRTDTNAGRAESRNTRWIIVTTVLASMFAVGALVVAMLTYGDAVFGRGMDVHKTIRDTVQEMQKATPEKK